MPHGVEGAIVGKALYAGAFTLPEALAAVAPRVEPWALAVPPRRHPRRHAVSADRLISSGGPWEDVVGYSRAVVAGPWVLVSGSTSTVDGEVRHEGDAYAQTLEAFGVVRRALEQAGLGLDDVVRTRMFLADMSHEADVARAPTASSSTDVRPAATMVEVAGFVDPRMLVEVEADAYRA